DASLPDFEPIEAAGSSSTRTRLATAGFSRSIERDLVGHAVTYRMISEGGDFGDARLMRIEEIGLELGHHVEHRFSIDERDPLSARTEIVEHLTMRRDDWEVRVSASIRLTATRESFLLGARLTARQGGDEVFDREWDERIERELV
ncbi:MAG TPA: peptidase S15, partial [Gammaproteobacteria bacterium]|nr:peptidase S15 [Gammaproteobacteria bacterium]